MKVGEFQRGASEVGVVKLRRHTTRLLTVVWHGFSAMWMSLVHVRRNLFR